MEAAAYWRCPNCLRRVPDKVAECYCGRKRKPTDGPDEADQAKSAGAGPILALVSLVGVGAFALWFFGRKAPAPVAPSVSAPASHDEQREVAPRVTLVTESAMPAGFGVAPTPAATPAAPARTPEPSASPPDGVDARREAGRLAFDVAAQNLQGRMAVLRRRIENLERTCPQGSTQITGCDGLRDELSQDAAGIREFADKAEEDARRSWVDPGFVREVRERYAIRDGDVDALLNEASEALKR